jgi:hypothetical protein
VRIAEKKREPFMATAKGPHYLATVDWQLLTGESWPGATLGKYIVARKISHNVHVHACLGPGFRSAKSILLPHAHSDIFIILSFREMHAGAN